MLTDKEKEKIIEQIELDIYYDKFQNETEKLLIQYFHERQIVSIFKNRHYGNSALEGDGCFSDGDPVAGIRIRMKDKMKRIIGRSDLNKDEKKIFTKLFNRVFGKNKNLLENNNQDLVGYEALLGVGKEWYGIESIKRNMD